jgi:EF-P beta-lysylation protein EpmB
LIIRRKQRSRVSKPVLSLIQSDLPEKWQQILSDLISEPKELLDILGLDGAEKPASLAAIDSFPMKVPRPFAMRMERGNWRDPLLLQVWPARDEEVRVPDLVADTLQESSFNPVPGLLHKYHGRVLLTAVPHCAIHCRYCFRRHFDYQANTPGKAGWQAALDYIAADGSIEEVILSGGDPLAASDKYLDWLLGELEAVPHVTSIRFHTRLPVVVPQRITPALRRVLQRNRVRTTIVVHCNHGRELDREVCRSLITLATDGHTLLNQSVLLRHINDNPLALVELGRRLFSAHVLPYYLHLPDRVAGTSHFLVSEEEGCRLIAELEDLLPGYLVPRLVREEPGAAHKTRIL